MKIRLRLSSKKDINGKSEILLSANKKLDGKVVTMYANSEVYIDPIFFDEAIGIDINKKRAIRPDVRRSHVDAKAKLDGILSYVATAETAKNTQMDKEWLANTIANHLHPKDDAPTAKTLQDCFEDYIAKSFKQGLFGKGRKAHYDIIAKELHRFLLVEDMEKMQPNEFTAERLSDFREFLFDEWNLVEDYPQLYKELNGRNIPTTRRSANTVATKLKLVQTILTDMEDKGLIEDSPFRKLGKQRKKVFMAENYDAPISLTLDELNIIRNTDVPETLKEVKDTFLVHCTIGARIGDFSSLGWSNVSVRNGIPFVHYLAKKTAHVTKNHKEIETPILQSTLALLKKHNFNFPLTRYPFGKSGYNVRIKQLLAYCKIDRQVTIYNEVYCPGFS